MIIKPIISKNIRMRYPELFTIGEGSIVDDFCYISVGLSVGKFSHISTGCSFVGGCDNYVRIGDFCGIVAGARLVCNTVDFVNDLATIIPKDVLQVENPINKGDVVFADYSAIGANSVMMPNNYVPEGVVIGALSYVPSNYPFEPWMIYFGTPIKPRKKRNRDSVLKQAEVVEKYLESS